MSASSPQNISIREIAESDLDDVVDLLAKGFRRRPLTYWRRGLDIMRKHPCLPEVPKYGHLLQNNGRAVGVILVISTAIRTGGSNATRCNISSWYVDPAFRSYAALLSLRATRNRKVTYLNVSPARHTLPIIEAEGFVRYSTGQFVTSAWSARGFRSARVFEIGSSRDCQFDSAEHEVLLDHARYSCISLWCETSNGAYPFVFLPRLIKGVMPGVQLVYCRSIDEFSEFRGPIGRFLAARGRPFILIDSNGPVRGLTGKYFEEVAPKYYKGPERPRLGDLAYTEAVMFGI